MNCRLIVIEFAFGVAIGIAEFNGVRATCGSVEGDDDHLLHIGVHHGAVDEATHTIVDGNVHVTEALVEADVDGIVTGARFNGIWTNACGQITLQDNFIKYVRHICYYIISRTNIVYVLKSYGLRFPCADANGTEANKK